MQIRPSQIMVMDSSVAGCRGEWAVRLPHAPPHGKHTPLLTVEARSAPASVSYSLTGKFTSRADLARFVRGGGGFPEGVREHSPPENV